MPRKKKVIAQVPKMLMPKRQTTDQNKQLMITALQQCLGIVAQACAQAEISRNTFYYWYHSDPDFKQQVDDISEITLDFVENKLFEAIKEKNIAAIIFYLRYKGRDRGYCVSQRVEYSGTVNVNKDNIKKLSDEQLRAIIAGESIGRVGVQETTEEHKAH